MNPFRLTAVLTLLLAAAPAAAQPSAEPLDGYWVSHPRFTPAQAGALEIVRQGNRGRATLGGVEAAFEFRGNEIAFAVPGRGRFRGRLVGGTIRGFWMGPARTADSSRPFADFTLLRAAGANRWRGEVRPLDDDYTLYLSVFRDSDGQPTASFRNPDRNDRGGATRFRIARDGEALRLTAGPDPANPIVTLPGRVVPETGRLRFDWPDLERPLELQRTTAAQIPGFFPRPPSDPPYAYRRPDEIGDGWRTAHAGEVGMDEAALANLVRRIAAADPTVRGAPLIHSLLVAHRGRLVLEEYFYGFDRDTPHDLRSAGKTFASIMLGGLMRRGTRIGPDSRIYELLARRGPFANPHPDKARITLAHLMTHSSGLDCNDNDENSLGNEDRMQNQTAQPDWWRYTLDLPMVHPPGTRYAYCSANMNLVGAGLTEASGTWLPELFDRQIAEPLQFRRWHWNLMPNGEGYLGGGAYILPRDLIKVGQAYLDGGIWNGRRIVDAGWVARSTAQAIEVTPATTGLDGEAFGNSYGGGGADGLAWHLGTVPVGDRRYRAYNANGNGGQILMIVPELDLVVVFTAENYRQGWIWGRWGDELVGGMIAPAVRPAAARR